MPLRQITSTAVAVTTFAVLVSCSQDNPAPTDSGPKTAATATNTPTPNYKPLPDQSGLIEAGRWAIRANRSAETPLAVIDVPTAGFSGGERWIWTEEAVIGYWTVAGVHKDPCARSDPAAPAGDSVEDLAAALEAQKLTTASDPLPVAVDGHEGLYLEVSTPAKLEYGTCHEDGLVMWDDAPSWSEPTVTRFWILDVEGQRVVLTLNGTEPVLTDMVESAEFVEG